MLGGGGPVVLVLGPVGPPSFRDQVHITDHTAANIIELLDNKGSLQKKKGRYGKYNQAQKGSQGHD